MIQTKDIDKVSDEDWEAFKKRAAQDELYYTGPGDLLDTPEGRSKFCRLNESSLYQKPDPDFPGYKISVFNNRGEGMVIKRRSRVDPALMEDVEYNAEGVEISRSYEPACPEKQGCEACSHPCFPFVGEVYIFSCFPLFKALFVWYAEGRELFDQPGRKEKIMNKKTSSELVRLIVWLVLFLAAAAIDRFVWPHPVVRVIAMAACVLFCAGLLILILGALKPKSHRGRTLVTLLSSLARYVAALVILCWGLSLFGVDVNTIVASVGVVALIVGFGAESLIADMVTGIFMLFENQYNVGDIVEVNGFRGTVKEIGIRTTSIVDTGRNVKIVNNSDMKNILNRSDNVSIAASTIDIPYPTDLEKLESQIPALMKEIFEKHSDVMLAEPRYLGVQALGASGVTLKFIVEIEEGNIFSVPRILNHDLLLGFRKLGVECPFPQVDVHNC